MIVKASDMTKLQREHVLLQLATLLSFLGCLLVIFTFMNGPSGPLLSGLSYYDCCAVW